MRTADESPRGSVFEYVVSGRGESDVRDEAVRRAIEDRGGSFRSVEVVHATRVGQDDTDRWLVLVAIE